MTTTPHQVLLKQAAEKERDQEKEKENLRRQLKIIMEIDPKGGGGCQLIDWLIDSLETSMGLLSADW